MRFWDTSAIVPLLVEEEFSLRVDEIFKQDPSLVVWWGTSIECISAVARLEREGKMSTEEVEGVLARLRELAATWREVQPSESVKAIAERILRLHPLRAQDAQQIAACIMVSTDHAIEFVTPDERLGIAARKEGLRVWT